MDKVRIKHKSPGYADLIAGRGKGNRIPQDHKARLERVAAAVGPEAVVEMSEPTHTRVRGAVIMPQGDPDNKIIRALDAGR